MKRIHKKINFCWSVYFFRKHPKDAVRFYVFTKIPKVISWDNDYIAFIAKSFQKEGIYMKKDVKLYNMMFPVWLLVIMPITWIPVLISNFLIDSLVLWLIMKAMRIDNKKQIYHKSIFKVWLIGMLCDIVGGALMFGVAQLFYAVELYDISNYIYYMPTGNVIALLIVIALMAITSLLIYLFDKKNAFKKTTLEPAQQKKIAFLISIITTPWLFLFPSWLIY